MKKIALALKKAVAVLVAAAFAVTATPAHAGGNGAAVVAVGVGVGLIVCYASGYCAPAKKPTSQDWKNASGTVEPGIDQKTGLPIDPNALEPGCRNVAKVDQSTGESYEVPVCDGQPPVTAAVAQQELCPVTDAQGNTFTVPCSALRR